MLKVLLITLIPIFLSACGTQNVRSNFEISGNSGSGVVIGSIVLPGAADGYTGFPQPETNVATIHYRKVGTSENHWIKVNEWLNPMYSGDFKEVVGKLYVLELPAGEYEIYSWDILSGVVYLGQSKNFSMKFSVPPAATKYLGEIKIKVAFGKNIFGLPIASTASISVSDSQQRDLDTVRRCYPNLSLSTVNTELLKTDEAPPETYRAVDLPLIIQPKVH